MLKFYCFITSSSQYASIISILKEVQTIIDSLYRYNTSISYQRYSRCASFTTEVSHMCRSLSRVSFFPREQHLSELSAHIPQWHIARGFSSRVYTRSLGPVKVCRATIAVGRAKLFGQLYAGRRRRIFTLFSADENSSYFVRANKTG